MGIENDFKCACPPGFTGSTLSEWFIPPPNNPKYDIRLLRDLPKFSCCEPVFVQKCGALNSAGETLAHKKKIGHCQKKSKLLGSNPWDFAIFRI